MATRGRFITLEGGEGVGKSTLATALEARLVARGIKVVRTREPGGTPGAEAIRRLILNPPAEVTGWEPIAETLLFYAARTDHLDKLIRPALAAGSWVICDRFSDSTRAYQAAAGHVPSEHIETIDRICVGDTTPDITLILDLPLSAARERMIARANDKDAIESRVASYHEAVHKAFLDIARANPRRCVVLDASAAPDALAIAALAAIDARLSGDR
ncbi:MAG TPA: dTMP kinase [Hyphomonadaceae bacterium]|nr:dTMP kinase [Hyphomonadaceae bacterium]